MRKRADSGFQSSSGPCLGRGQAQHPPLQSGDNGEPCHREDTQSLLQLCTSTPCLLDLNHMTVLALEKLKIYEYMYVPD